MMVTEVTEGIKITVKTFYRPDFSDPQRKIYLFSYRITIENQSQQTVKLLRRKWHIFDSCGEYRHVEGEGVVGQQPVLDPGAVHEYESACNLMTEIGRMGGEYVFERVLNHQCFTVVIPVFDMYVPYRLN